MEKVTLVPIEGVSQIYTGRFPGEKKDVVIAYRERNRKDAENAKLSTVFSPKQIQHAKKEAEKSSAEAYVATLVRIDGRFHASYAVPIADWPKFHRGAADFPVCGKIIEEYFADEKLASAANRYMGFGVALADAAKVKKAKPAPKAKAEKKAGKKKHRGGSVGAAPATITGSADLMPATAVSKVPDAPAPQKRDLALEIAEGLNTQHHPDSGPKASAPSPEPSSTTWSPEQEAEIARYQETEGLSRKLAVQKMRRSRIKAAAEARA